MVSKQLRATRLQQQQIMRKTVKMTLFNEVQHDQIYLFSFELKINAQFDQFAYLILLKDYMLQIAPDSLDQQR
jgi:hypothetical protein